MQSITLRAHVGSDGILQLQVPLEFTDRDLEVIVVYQPLPTQDEGSDELGWFPAIPDLERHPQGEAPERASFDD